MSLESWAIKFRGRVLGGKVQWLLWGMLLLGAPPAGAAEIDLSKGQLKHAGDVVVQVVAAKNNAEAPITALYVECGFFHGDALLGAGTGTAFNVEAGQTAYIEVIVDDASDSDRTECRVSGIER
jgi:hypothetical protein